VVELKKKTKQEKWIQQDNGKEKEWRRSKNWGRIGKRGYTKRDDGVGKG
jgi:hypothetical protein